MPLNLFYTMVQKKSKMTKNSNQGGVLPWPIFLFFSFFFLLKKSVTEGRSGLTHRIRCISPMTEGASKRWTYKLLQNKRILKIGHVKQPSFLCVKNDWWKLDDNGKQWWIPSDLLRSGWNDLSSICMAVAFSNSKLMLKCATVDLRGQY